MNAQDTILIDEPVKLSQTADEQFPVPMRRQDAAMPAAAEVPVYTSLLQLAVKQNASIEMLERLMDMHRRHEAEEARKAFVASMAAFKREPLTIFKRKQVGYTTRDNEFVSYSHAELSDVTDVVGPAMAKHGLSYRWDVQQREGRVHVTCIVTHERGHSETVTMDAPPDSSGKKNSIQQIASAATYLQRYTLLAATGMATKGMDDDGRGANDEGASDDPLLEGFRDAAMRGYASLRAHYEANVPTEEFWAKHSASLKECARRADQEKTK